MRYSLSPANDIHLIKGIESITLEMDLQTYLRFQFCEVAIRKKLRYDGEIMNFSSLNWNMDV
jgi:hypothetical protein